MIDKNDDNLINENNISEEEKDVLNEPATEAEIAANDNEAHDEESEEPFTDETAFNREFDPSFAVFSHDDKPESSFEEPNNKAMDEAVFAAEDDDAKEDSAPFETDEPLTIEQTFERIDSSTDTEYAQAEQAPISASIPVQKEKKSFFKSFEKKTSVLTAGIAAAVVILLTVIVLAANGLIPVFASEDVYGIFVNGKLVAAANSQEKIEEAIDDFLSYYKTLEEQGSLSNLSFSAPYEIRELSRDEIKENIYKAKRGASKTAEVTENTSEENSETEATAENSGETTTESKDETQDKSTETSEKTPPRSTMAMETDATGGTIYPTTNQENPLNLVDGKIAVSKSIEDLQNVLFYGEVPETYTVVEGDNLSKIAKREGLTLTELMVPNPDLLEDSTIGIDQEIKIVRMSGPMKLKFSREVTYTEDIEFKTVEQKTNDLYVGETRISQQGKEGIRQEVTKYDYENNRITVKTPISDEVMEQPTNKIVQIGTKPKTSPAQSSNITNAPSQTSSSGFSWPVSGARLTSRFGPRKSPKRGASSYHRGIDLAIGSGTPIYAAQSGTVTIAARTGGYGNLVEINHGGGLTTRYGHCSVLKVKRGQKVNKGDLIALVGSTGVSTGPHLHFEVRRNGTAVNPLSYLP